MLMPQHEHVSVVHIAPCTFISNLRKPEELKKIWLSAYPIYRILIWLSADQIHPYINLSVCRSDTPLFQSGCLQIQYTVYVNLDVCRSIMPKYILCLHL
jgi:hypothetical protein